MKHFIFSEEGWRKAQSLKHPTITLTLSTDERDYKTFGYLYKRVENYSITVVPDSGAQACLWGRIGFLDCGFKMNDLIPVQHMMKSASRTTIQIDGAVIVRLSGKCSNGQIIQAAVIVYISPQATTFYLSKEAMVQLEIIHKNFPQVGSASNNSDFSISAIIGLNDTVKALCGCLPRTKAPSRPSQLPYAATLQNADMMKQWLFKYFASSTFNECEHQILPEMDGPPLELHVDPGANL